MMPYWSNKQVLITGATGFIGYWLTRVLVDKQACVVALVQDEDYQCEFFKTGLYRDVTIIKGELESYLTLERIFSNFNIETVFHLGAQTLVQTAYRNPLLTFESNIRGTYHLLEACRKLGDSIESIVIASSDKAYGTQPSLPYFEEMPLQGRYPYDVSKSCADLISQSYFHTYHLPITIARCCNIYGGGDRNFSRLIPGTIRSLFEKKPPIIRSDGSYIREYLYIKDVVSAYLVLAEKTKSKDIQGESFNFGSSHPCSVLDTVHLISQLMECPQIHPTILNEAIGEIKDQYLNWDKSQELLGWFPKYSFKEGLIETIEWYKKGFTHAVRSDHIERRLSDYIRS